MVCLAAAINTHTKGCIKKCWFFKFALEIQFRIGIAILISSFATTSKHR